MKVEKKLISVVITAGVITASIIQISQANALGNSQPIIRTFNVTAMDQYKLDYAAYKDALVAWNVNRNQQIASYMDARNAYSALALSNQKARLQISEIKITAITDANNAYAAAILKTSNAASRKGLLTARNAKILAASSEANRAVAALPALGTKPVWPVAAPRPVKPVKPVTP